MVRGKEDRAFDIFVYIVLLVIGLIAVFPLLYVVSVSLTPMEELMRNGGFVIIPKKITFEAYTEVLTKRLIPQALKVTVLITILGTAISLIISVMLAYPLSKKGLKGRKVIMPLIIFTMLFSGGLIPTYLVVKGLGALDTIWAMILPGMVSTFNLLVLKGFFENLPQELFESAKMDGAREFKILVRIVLPLSIPVIMTVGLFYAVTNWNQFFSAIIYINNKDLQPLQVVLREILMSASDINNVDVTLPSDTLKMASVIIASTPIIVVYPFIQKYFVKGMMMGAVKG